MLRSVPTNTRQRRDEWRPRWPRAPCRCATALRPPSPRGWLLASLSPYCRPRPRSGSASWVWVAPAVRGRHACTDYGEAGNRARQAGSICARLGVAVRYPYYTCTDDVLMAQAGRDDAGHTGRAGSEVNVRARERTARRLLIAGAREGRAGADDDIYDAVRHAHADRASMQRRAQTVALRRVTLRRIDPISDPSLDLPPCPPPVGSRSPRHAREYLRPTTAARPGDGNENEQALSASSPSLSPPCMARRPLEEAQGPVGPAVPPARLELDRSHRMVSPACYPSSPRVPTPER